MDTVHRMNEMGEKYIILVRKSEQKTPLGRPGSIWHDNIKVCLKNKLDTRLYTLRVSISFRVTYRGKEYLDQLRDYWLLKKD